MSELARGMMSNPSIRQWEGGEDPLAIEEPLEIRLEFWEGQELRRKSVSVTMRTPGHDFELALGFLFTEGIIQRRENIQAIRHCGPQVEGKDFHNIVRVEVHPDVPVNTTTMERNFYTTSSCGICGKTSLEALKINNHFGATIKERKTPRINRERILTFPRVMRSQQHLFQRTGGCHASALFDEAGNLICLREDVGRHNAMDKVIGWALMNDRLPLHDNVIVVSGRASFELMQKASMGGIPLFAAIGAPSTLAVQAAKEFDITLVGFISQHQFNIYHDPGRIEDQRGSYVRPTQPNGTEIEPALGSSTRRSPSSQN